MHTNTQTDANTRSLSCALTSASGFVRHPFETFDPRVTIVCLKTQGNDYFSAMYKVIRFLLLCLVFDLLYIHELLNASATLFVLGRGRAVDTSTGVVTGRNVSFSCDSVKCWVTCRLFILLCFFGCVIFTHLRWCLCMNLFSYILRGNIHSWLLSNGLRYKTNFSFCGRCEKASLNGEWNQFVFVAKYFAANRGGTSATNPKLQIPSLYTFFRK